MELTIENGQRSKVSNELLVEPIVNTYIYVPSKMYVLISALE